MKGLGERRRAPRNRTVTISTDDTAFYQRNLVRLSGEVKPQDIENKTIDQDLFEALEWLPT
jgi:site-specific DNA-methyltransferase (adenine-specific)